MKTYLHAPQCPQNELEEILSARNDIRHALRSSRNSRGCLENLFGMLRPFFPVSFLLITEPRDIEEQRRLHVYPQVGGRDILSGTYEREYLRPLRPCRTGPCAHRQPGRSRHHYCAAAQLPAAQTFFHSFFPQHLRGRKVCRVRHCGAGGRTFSGDTLRTDVRACRFVQ